MWFYPIICLITQEKKEKEIPAEKTTQRKNFFSPDCANINILI